MFRLEHETRQGSIAGRTVFRRRQNDFLEHERDLRLIGFARLEMPERGIERAKAHKARIGDPLIENIAGKYAGVVGDPCLRKKWLRSSESLPAGGSQRLRFILEPDTHGGALDPGIVVKIDQKNLGIGKARAVLYPILLEGEVAAVG